MKLLSINYRFILNTALLIISALFIDIKYVSLVAFVGFIFIFFKLPNKYFAHPILLILLLIFTDASFIHADSQMKITEYRFNLADTPHSPLIWIYKTIACILSYLTVIIFFRLSKKFKLDYFSRNLLFFIITISSVYLFSLKSESNIINLNLTITYFFLTTTLMIRSCYLEYEDYGATSWNFIKKISPPIFDNSYFLRHSINKSPSELTPTISHTAITKKTIHFLIFYSLGFILNKIFFSNDEIILLKVPNLELTSPNLIVELGKSRFLLAISIFLKGLLFILNTMSLTLFLESAYIIFGYEIKEHFKFKFQSNSFSEFFSNIMPMHSDLLKSVFIFPGFKYFSKYTNSRALIYIGIFIVIFLVGFGINVMKFLSFQGNFNLTAGIFKLLLTDIISYLIIVVCILLFKANLTVKLFPRILLNLLFVFILGVVTYVRFKSLTVPLTDKLNLLSYIFLGTTF
jgi:hypothetical protein